MIQVGILAIPGCLNSAVFGLGEILTQANHINGVPIFSHLLLTADGKAVKGYTGAPIVPESTMGEANPDVIVLPPILGSIETALSNEKIIKWLTDNHTSGKSIATVCAGSFFLAETGILDGRDATTHWNLADIFRQRYPLINLQEQRLIVDGGDYICSGGVSSWMDLALHLVTRHAGREISLKCVKMMLMDPHREYQTPYGMGGFRRNHGDGAILKIQLWLEQNYTSPILTKDMAKKAALGERTFMRRFSSATGESPRKYLQKVRVIAAQTLLETSDLSVEEIAESTGYGDNSTFRKLFKRLIGSTPSAYRQRFGVMGK